MGKRLLIVTQVVDAQDSNLGFFCQRIEEFSHVYQDVIVVAQKVGNYTFQDNVTVYSLGKEHGTVPVPLMIWKFLRLQRILRKTYDEVFVHMIPIFVMLGGSLWRIRNKKIKLWYTHGSVSKSLWIAEKLVDTIYTVQKKGFNLKTPKVVYTGHGINTTLFKPLPKVKKNAIVIGTVGRITPSKNIDQIIRVFSKYYHSTSTPSALHIYGSCVKESDGVYLEKCKTLARDLGVEKVIERKGGISNTDLPNVYAGFDLFINLSDTGSIDKVVLEAMACQIPVVTTNSAYAEILSHDGYVIDKDDDERIVKKVNEVIDNNMDTYREYVAKNHSLLGLINKLSK